MDNAMAEKQIQHLMTMADADLLEMIGTQMRQAEIAELQAPERLEAAKKTGELEVLDDGGIVDGLREFGQRWWDKIEPQVYNLLCRGDSPERESLLATLPQPTDQPASTGATGDHDKATARIATVLAPLLVGLIPFQIPLVASAAATIAARTILSSGLSTACDIWAERMQRENQL